MKKFFLIAALALANGCVHRFEWQPDGHKEYLYYVIDVNGTEPDASFEKKKDALKYIDDFKEFHTYRIVKAQNWASLKEHE